MRQQLAPELGQVPLISEQLEVGFRWADVSSPVPFTPDTPAGPWCVCPHYLYMPLLQSLCFLESLRFYWVMICFLQVTVSRTLFTSLLDFLSNQLCVRVMLCQFRSFIYWLLKCLKILEGSLYPGWFITNRRFFWVLLDLNSRVQMWILRSLFFRKLWNYDYEVVIIIMKTNWIQVPEYCGK